VKFLSCIVFFFLGRGAYDDSFLFFFLLGVYIGIDDSSSTQSENFYGCACGEH
jgi:hypothetical protein